MTDPKFELELDRFIEADIDAWIERRKSSELPNSWVEE
jgi:hypothetical protein